jgi:glycosyltransferase involved in cell wall biosynthesis
MRSSLIITVLNEENTITALLKSVEQQTAKPDEIIIADGGSSDRTKELIIEFQKNSKLKLKLIEVKGNRSIGRNTAIAESKGDIILSTDAGCILDKDWVRNITKPFSDTEVDVVAGYYKGRSGSVFGKSLIPYVLVMPDKVDKDNFLPATRSMAIKKSVWEKTGGFDNKLSHNEDYAFAVKIKEKGFKIIFAKEAVVLWLPPETLREAFFMFYRFAYGDAESGIIRPKVVLIFLRYAIGLVLLLTGNILLLLASVIVYAMWSAFKNYKYVKEQAAYYYLPILQFTSDTAVLIGTSIGLTKRF